MTGNDWRQRAKRVTPGGAQTRSKRDLYPTPVAVAAGDGAYVWDREGTRYTDWVAGLCALGLGHRHHEVDAAVVAQLKNGVTFPLPTYLEVEVAEQLCELLRWPESVRWVKTGSEATAGAMLIARKATGRHGILSIGYHGWHPGHLKGAVTEIRWGDLKDTERHLVGSYVAGVIVEVMRDDVPPTGYLRDLKTLCHKHGALLIVDEVVTGFRWAVGGACEMFGVTPDLACFGKALANGYALGAIVGSRDIMAYADGVSSTFGGECVGLAAAQATMRVYARDKVIERLWEMGKLLVAEMARVGRPMAGYPVHPRFVMEPDERVLLSHAAAARGHLFLPSAVNVMYAHTPEDVRAFAEAVRP